MASTMFDSVLYRDVFSTPAMRAVFSDEAQLKAYVQAEVALAVAQGEAGVIPQEAAQAIARQAPTIAFDSEQLKTDTENVGYPIVGLVRQLSQQLGEAGRYVHWGATTQDIMDTATVLQLREAVALIEAQLVEVMATLADLARLHRDTPMAGRTHLQQALPITFGHKVAIWLSALQRSADRLAQAKPRALQAQLGGAVGTLASLGERGLDVRAAYARALGLNEPDITWHVARDGLGEVFEPFSSHRGASSTMPQKRNPISSEVLLANAKMSRDAASLMLDSMVQDLERATGPWHCEWLALPQVCLLTAGSLAQAQFMLSGLIVDQAAMKRNLASTRGLIVAEAVMMGLAPALGRQLAHDEVYAACREAFTRSEPLLDALLRRPAIAAALPRDQLAALCEPSNYLGTAGAMVDRVLARHAKR
jgi:3-carboxy-cis,cis-muconate cycloisomerase